MVMVAVEAAAVVVVLACEAALGVVGKEAWADRNNSSVVVRSLAYSGTVEGTVEGTEEHIAGGTVDMGASFVAGVA